jgi:hypothetical protein
MNQSQGKAVEITKEIFHVGGSQLTSPEDAAIYLINFDGHAALVDAGCGDGQDRLIPKLCSSLGHRNPKKVFGTSCPGKISQSFCS